MSRMGMDVDAVEQAGRDLEDRAAQLGQLIGRIDRIARGLPTVWEGKDSQEFTRTLWPQHRKTLATVQEHVASLGRTAWQNAQAQRETSETLASGAGGGSLHSSASSDGGPGRQFGGHGVTPAEIIAQMPDALRHSVQDYINTVRDGDIGGVKPWEMAGLISNAAKMAGIDSNAFGGFSSAFDSVTIANKLLDGDATVVFDAGHVMGDMVSKIPSPVGKLGGLAIHSVTLVAEEASKADFSPSGVATVIDYVKANPGVAVQEVGKATVEVGTKVAGWVVGLFK